MVEGNIIDLICLTLLCFGLMSTYDFFFWTYIVKPLMDNMLTESPNSKESESDNEQSLS